MTQASLSLVIGSEGRIGSALAERLKRAGAPWIATTCFRDRTADDRVFLDLSEDVSQWRPPRPVSAAYLCAAAASLESCRKDPAGSARINVRNTVVLAKTLVNDGAFVVFPSTNMVFDGTAPNRKATDPVSPRTEYGRQKVEVERQLSALGNSAAVVRLTKVVGPDMPLFTEWIRALRNGEVIRPLSDMVFSPVPLTFAVEVLYQIGRRRVPGIIQVSGEKDITYEEAARFIARRIGADPALVRPMETKQAGLPAEAAPLHTTLDTTGLREEPGLTPPDVWTAMETVLDS